MKNEILSSNYEYWRNPKEARRRRRGLRWLESHLGKGGTRKEGKEGWVQTSSWAQEWSQGLKILDNQETGR